MPTENRPQAPLQNQLPGEPHGCVMKTARAALLRPLQNEQQLTSQIRRGGALTPVDADPKQGQ